MDAIDHGELEALRQAEFDLVRDNFRPGMRVLEIGGGSGYQARLMSDLGCEVLSIDLTDRPAPAGRFHPVQPYNGRNIPAAPESFDLIFSSNVLEHVTDLPALLCDMRRVLRPGGKAIHILPSTAWRLLTTLAFPLYAFKRLTGLQAGLPYADRLLRASDSNASLGAVPKLLTAVSAPLRAHGAFANAFVELWTYRRRWWIRTFHRHAFETISIAPTRLLYSGYGVFTRLPLAARRNLSRFLGSACHIYVTRPRP
jgi:SAM-dependent methyltransferase